MNILNTVWRFSFGKDKHVAEGHKVMAQIQSLLVEATAKYEGVPHALTLKEIAPIKTICDELLPAHFLLKVPKPGRSTPERHKHVHYQHVYADKTFSIGLFIVPPGVSIPLHDHPGMSVISRILYGSVHITSYDLVNKAKSRGKTQRARRCVDKVLTAPHTMELLPDCGNLHELVGGNDIGCAFLDIITPPYDATSGRACTYFRVLGLLDSQDTKSEEVVVLGTYDPLDFAVVSTTYDGPKL